jgi:hypothetical protein
MPASELIERVSDLIAGVEAEASPGIREQLAALQLRLREPPRVAVVGRVKAGKSTLVNALLGQRVAPTDVSECTQVVTWFRYGHPERIVIQLRDGSSTESQLTAEGTLPSELGVPPESVASIQAYLTNEPLRSMTLIDTPGIGSVHAERSASTEELLRAERDSTAAGAGADAVVFLLNQTMMEDELKVLELFQPGSANRGKSAANTVGVLSRADQLGDGGDPWQVAVELSNHYAGVFRNQVATVVPVIGLIAETAEAACFTEHDVQQLGALATADAKQVERLMWSADRFVSAEAPVPSDDRERLLVLLDLYGIRQAINLIGEGVGSAGRLRRELSSRSGIAEVKRMLNTYFHEHDHLLKVRSALDILDGLSYGHGKEDGRGALLRMRSEVEALRLDPVMQPLAELEVWHDCLTGRVQLPSEYAKDMRRLFAPGTPANRLGVDTADPAQLREAARAAMARWRTFMVSEATPVQARVARVVTRSYQLLWEATQ